jgi:hypothetical protein
VLSTTSLAVGVRGIVRGREADHIVGNWNLAQLFPK